MANFYFICTLDESKNTNTEYGDCKINQLYCKIQNEFMRPSFLPKCKPKITRISALPNKQGS